MTVPEGTFRLYSRVDPPLTAGDYRLTSTPGLTATRPGQALDADDLRVQPLTTHLRVRAPQYVLPPDQVLSTYPPAGSEGAYGSRLPQVVIRRRTLPWERSVGEGLAEEPWLALVLIAQGEAELRMNQPVADCVTPGVELDTPADVELGNCLAVRKSVVDRIFPTQEEVRLLAHAREVDIGDTELMMGDDDGYLAVVISNRLPLPGRDAQGEEVPVKYLACLVNLCGQFADLLEEAPEPARFTQPPRVILEPTLMTLAGIDHAIMGTTQVADGPVASTVLSPSAQPKAAVPPTQTRRTALDQGLATPYDAGGGWTEEVAAAGRDGVAGVYTAMGQPFTSASVGGFLGGAFLELDRTLVFPVLLHWGFTSTGSVTFRSLMEGLSSGLLGTEPPAEGSTAAEVSGRPPFEYVETGHIGLAHRTRRGDAVRSWYRGPLVPHPTADPPQGRLALAHAADQVRVVVPDGREDITLAAAFELGRLLALSRPSMVSSLLRWRQSGYQAAQRGAVLAGHGSLLELLELNEILVDRDWGPRLTAMLAGAIVAKPEEFLGDPRPLVTAGRQVVDSVSGVNTVLAQGLGIEPDVLSGSAAAVLGRLQETEVRVPRAGVDLDAGLVTEALQPRLEARFDQLVRDALRAGDLIDGVIDAQRGGAPT